MRLFRTAPIASFHSCADDDDDDDDDADDADAEDRLRGERRRLPSERSR